MDSDLTDLLNKLDDGEMMCKASDIAPLFEMDAAGLRCIALHAKDQLPFASYVISKNICSTRLLFLNTSSNVTS